MSYTHRTRMRTLATLAVAGAAALPTPALADEPAEAPGSGVTLDITIDFVSEYWFRGIGQENEGLIVQPGATLTFDLFETSGGAAVTGYVGSWNSYQDATAGNEWFESDMIGGFNIALPNGDSIDLSYINLYNPAGNGIFAEEIDLSYAIDDSERFGGMGLSPYILLAVEVDGGSDAGGDEGVYLEIGIEPALADILGSESLPVDVAVPVTLGLSLDSYYEDGMGGDDDDTFGYLDIGVVASTPLDGLIPAGLGSWEASFGVHYLYLGDTAQNISAAFGTGNDSSTVYATIGISTSF